MGPGDVKVEDKAVGCSEIKKSVLDKSSKMATILEPPSFVSEKKSFGEYKKDLLRWSRLTSLDKKVQAEMVVYRLEGHPSRIKEKITTQTS